jgi:hypothetical protein
MMFLPALRINLIGLGGVSVWAMKEAVNQLVIGIWSG